MEHENTYGQLDRDRPVGDAAPAKAQEIVPARDNPELGFGRATSWLGLGGGDAAHHCQAVALVELGQHSDGARRFEELAQEIRARPSFRAELLAQAAQAWLLAGQPVRAEGMLNSALGLDPNNPELFVDHAQAAAAMGAWKRAEDDLSAALDIDPELSDALVFCAAARRHLDDTKMPSATSKQPLNLSPAISKPILKAASYAAGRGAN